ncbi:MAG: site-2 protease family protein [Candidatus Pacearchaeota archaeon]
MYLYKTKWGIDLINRIANKYKNTIRVLSYFSIITGYILMIGVIYVFYSLIKLHIFLPETVRMIKVPPIMPLIPYLPQVFKIGFLPPFYFTYWILIIAVIAITHEVAHGIVAASNNVKIKTTGFGFFPFFLPIFLAAFVEPDENTMKKKTKFAQMAILTAGVFANVLTGILVFVALTSFFYMAFSPSGIIYDNYATTQINLSEIILINGVTLEAPNYEKIMKNSKEGLNEILTKGGGKYLLTKEMLEKQKNMNEIYVYYDAPAIRENLSAVITEINNIPVQDLSSLTKELSRYSPGDEVVVKSITENGVTEKKIILGENPIDKEKAWLGIGFLERNEKNGILSNLLNDISNLFSFKKPHVYYKPKFNGLSIFIYNLLWWLVIISFSVALINMTPFGIFDGGRFFYLTILTLTKSENIAKKSFDLATKLFFLFIVFLFALWVASFFR